MRDRAGDQNKNSSEGHIRFLKIHIFHSISYDRKEKYAKKKSLKDFLKTFCYNIVNRYNRKDKKMKTPNFKGC